MATDGRDEDGTGNGDGRAAPRPSSASVWGDRARFLGAMIRSPRSVGSVVPTGRPVSRLMASHVSGGSNLPVLELGPGTGPVTRAILERGVAPSQLYIVEFSADLHAHLKTTFPDVNVIHGDAFNLDTALAGLGLAQFDCVVSGVPLLNFGQAARNALLQGALARVPPGRPMVQITYGPRPPVVPDDPSIAYRGSRRILRNVPPARVWTYWRDPAQTGAMAVAA